MYQLDLGPWGIDLDDSAYGMALAALGVGLATNVTDTPLEAAMRSVVDADLLRTLVDRREPMVWAIGRIADSPAEWESVARAFPADAAAAAWRTAVREPEAEDVPRLVIVPEWDRIGPYAWLADQLNLPSTFAASFVPTIELQSTHSWHWPLRVGMLGGWQAEPWAQSVRPDATIGRLARAVDLDQARALDILLVPRSMRQGVAELVHRTETLDLGLVVFLGGLGGETEADAHALFGAIQLRTSPWGVAIADVPPSDADQWFASLVWLLSHDTTLDVALRGASTGLPGRRRTLLFAEPDNLSQARASISGARLVSAMRDGPSLQAIELPKEAQEILHLDRIVDREVVHHAMARPDVFRRETLGATAVASMAERLEEVRGRTPIVAVPRWIQVDVQQGQESVGRSSPLEPLTTYAVDVWIGPPGGEGVQADVVFPEHEFPRDRSEHDLKVVLAEIGGAGRATTRTLTLPPTGTSPRCRFHFRTGVGPRFEARVIVLYKNRILQTARLSIDVGERAAEVGKPTLRFVIESMVRPGIAELKGRRSFSVALVHNQDEHGTEGGTAIAGDVAVPLNLGDLSPTVRKIQEHLSLVADDPDSYGPGLDATSTVQLLYKLALQGVDLRRGLLDGRRRLAALLKDAPRIQILAADANHYLPIEFVYDFPPPSKPRLCRNAVRALRDGHCESRFHRVAKSGSIPVVCPVGFWAMTRVIERHGSDPERFESDLRGIEFEVDSDPGVDRNRLGPLGTAIFAASSRVDELRPGGTELVERSLTSATGQPCERVKTWEDWLEVIGERNPTLLVLLAHTAHDDLAGESALEIEVAERTPFGNVERPFVRPKEGIPPIVFLLGCDTAIAASEYQTFAVKFRSVGAALVVGTVATVAGSHAAVVASSLALALLGARSEATVFGDVLRDTRRKLLADGEVMALCVTAFGDADWRLPPASP